MVDTLAAVFCNGPKDGQHEGVEAYYGSGWPPPLVTCMRCRPVPLNAWVEPEPRTIDELPALEVGTYELIGRFGTEDRWVFVYEWRGWQPWPPVST